MAKKNLVSMAKGGTNKTTKTGTTAKTTGKTKKSLTPAKERDLKAKQKVEELLSDVELTQKKDGSLLEMENEPIKGVDWLEEQVSKLSEENSKLKNDLVTVKEDYNKLFSDFQKVKKGETPTPVPDTELKGNVVKLFDEIQANYMAMGKNFVIVPPAFLNRLITFFPFLKKQKKF